MKRKEKRRGGIILQVAVLFVFGVLVTGLLTYLTEQNLSSQRVKRQTEEFASQIADEVRRSVGEYPAAEWLMQYWYEHADTLQIDYDEEFTEDSLTAGKSRLLAQRYPELSQEYATTEELEKLPEEDQKLYAEISYSWLITRLNQIKRAYNVDYLIGIVTEEPYDSQFFLFSAADPGGLRGTEYEQVYPLGHVVSVNESQQDGMRSAKENSSHLAAAGGYMDYYEDFWDFDNHTVLIGLVYNVTGLHEETKALSRKDTRNAILNQIFLSLLCLMLLYFVVLKPLKEVQKNIRFYRDTKDSAVTIRNLTKVHPNNEIGQLSEDVSELAEEIEEHVNRIETITAERERVSAELNMATEIQKAMLPSVFPAFPERTEFDVYASMDPAREVGGDFYDFFFIDDDHLYLVMADVSGKGVPAALFMMMSKILLASNAREGRSPAEILRETNRTICQNNPQEMFVTVWAGILEISTGKLVAANAGHEYPVVKKPDGPFELLKDKHGLVIGAMDEMKYQEYEIRMEPGEKLFLYTDGVPEATNAAKQLFGTGRMIEAMNQDPAAPPKEILQNVRSAVDGFVQEEEQFDDLTMLCMEYRGPVKEKENG